MRARRAWGRAVRLPQIEPLEPRQMLAVSLSNVALVADTGASSTDRITTDPRVQGIASGFTYGAHADVQFDHNNDGVVNGSVSCWCPGGSFQYDPRTWDSSLNGYAGPLPLRYRWVEYNPYGTIVGTGSWTDFTITLETTGSPEIAVFDQSQAAVYDGTTTVAYGSTTVGTPVYRTFSIQNTGTSALSLNTGSLTLPSGYSVVTPFASSVAPSSSTTFAVKLDATATGTYDGQISFATNDADENPSNVPVTVCGLSSWAALCS